MLDTVYLHPPSRLKEIEEVTKAIGFTMGSDWLTGSLLRTLAATKPAGMLLELGTGTGMATSWLLDGMDAQSQLVTVDRDERAPAVARKFLGNDPRITFRTMEGVAFIEAMQREGKSFDLIFADMVPGKYEKLDEVLSLLKVGGVYVIDDMLLLSSWAEEHVMKAFRLISTLERRKDVRITKLNWSTGLIIAVKVG